MQKGGAGGVHALSGRKPDPIWLDQGEKHLLVTATPVVNDSNAKKVKYNHFSHLALFIIIILSYS